ncbi:ABC transporter, permease protein, putative [hydrothermal vent metagenome]|uniref:ABC transporter, permease protein, putative n=1 Tax=hydrothermal vent metagenome TaxID=652676 RepID=A0A3B0VQA9_9ZZZZ
MINTYLALIKREYWEHRGAFIKTPIIIGIVMIVLTIIGYITGLVLTNKSGANDLVAIGIWELSQLPPDQLVMFWEVQALSISSLYLTVLFFVLFFFLLGSLFDDRKDQSILFWKSLPISDNATVLSKLLTAMFLVPLIFVAVFLLLSFVLMLLFTIVLLFHGLNPIQLVWSPASLFSAAKLALTGVFVQMLWALPIYGWLIFSSSISKRRPFLFAVFVPAIVAFSWYWVNVLTFQFTNFNMFKLPLRYISNAMFPYTSDSLRSGGFHFGPNSFGNKDGSVIDTISLLKSSVFNGMGIIYGAIFAAIMVSLAIWLRRYRNTV